MWTVFVVFVVLVSLVSPAEALILCARKDKMGDPSGSIAIRDVCKKNEVQLDPVALGLVKPAPGILVKDANGVFFGFAIDGGGQILHQTKDALVAIDIPPDGSFPQYVPFSYESHDCSGPERMAVRRVFGGLLSDVRVGYVVGMMLYYPSTSGTYGLEYSFAETPVQASSCVGSLPARFIPPDTCCFTRSQPTDGFYSPPATADLSTFVPPLRVDTETGQ